MKRRPVTWNRAKFIKLCDGYKANKHAASFKITVEPEGELEFQPDYARHLISQLEPSFAIEQQTKRPQNQGDESTVPGSPGWNGDWL